MNAWEYTLHALEKFFERLDTLPPEQSRLPMPNASITKLAAAELSGQAKELLGTYGESARVIGELTAAMHLAFAFESENKRFIPEPFTPHTQRGLFQSMRNLTRQSLQLLNRQLGAFPPEVQAQGRQVLALEADILNVLRQICDRPLNVVRTRQHGDYHLGQLLYTGKDFLIIDFEGEPSVSISERRLKHSPLKDVASMVQSFHYAGFAALLDHAERRTLSNDQLQSMASWARFWSRWAGAIFYRAYLKAAAQAPFLPSAEADLQMMTDVFLLRNAIYDLGYELNHRPDWVKIALQEILELLNPESPV
jgi:maltose alpha-D-glucosyltransferase/alpha-amylase